MLKRLYVHNLRAFVNFEWKPPAACVIVGPNGAGKSALLEVLWFLQEVLVDGKRVEDNWLEATTTAWLKEPEQTIEVDIEHLGETFNYRIVARRELGGPALHEELRAGDGLLYQSDSGKVSLFGNVPSQQARTTIPFDRRRSFLAVLEPRPDNKRLIAFRDAVQSIWAMKPDPRRISGAAQEESRSLVRDLSNFANWYRAKVAEDPDAAEQMRADLRSALSGFAQLRLEPVTQEIKDLRTRFEFGGRTHELPWARLSDGQRQLIALYGMLRFGLSKASTIVLDEIENYVAPSEIQPWLRAVGDVSHDGGKQLIVISHHPEAIDYLAADAVWRMWRDRDAGHTRIALLEPDRSTGESAYDIVKRAPADA